LYHSTLGSRVIAKKRKKRHLGFGHLLRLLAQPPLPNNLNNSQGVDIINASID
jgi:hypothetical protein